MANNNLKLTIQFFKEEPIVAARKLDIMQPEGAAALLEKVPLSIASKVFLSMLPKAAAGIVVHTSHAYSSALFQLIEIADVAAILRYVSDDREALIQLLPKSRQSLCRLLISYPDNTVGTLIETNVLVIDNHMTVAEAMLRVRKQTYFENHEVIIVNRFRKIVGKLSIFDLLRAPGTALVSTLPISKAETVNGLSDVSTVLAMDLWRKTDSIAVVNRKLEFIGILRHFDLRGNAARNEITSEVKPSLTGEVVDAYSDVLSAISELFIDPKTV